MINEHLKLKLNQTILWLILVSLKINHLSKSLFNINPKICIINLPLLISPIDPIKIK